MKLPRNASSIVRGRERGVRPADPVVISFVGDTGWENPHVYADSGEVYDWSFLIGLRVLIVVKPGIECQQTIRDIFAACSVYRDRLGMFYPTLIDIESQTVASIFEVHPLRLFPENRSYQHRHWKEMFS